MAKINPEFQIVEKIRVERDMTYQEIGDEMGVNFVTLHNTIFGRTDPNARTRFKIEKWINNQIKSEKTNV